MMTSEEKSEVRYYNWWYGKKVNMPYIVRDGKIAVGTVTDVKYIGNSVYGDVMITLDNGCIFRVPKPISVYKSRKNLIIE